MTNFEYYKEEIKSAFAMNKLCEFRNKYGVGCAGSGNYITCNTCRDCNERTEKWLDKEHTEINWSKVEVDTPIVVKDCIKDKGRIRYFSKYEDGRVYAFCDGRTSLTAGNDPDIDWEYAELYQDKKE